MNTLEVLEYYITVANKLFCSWLYKNKYIIVHLTEVFMLYLYLPKFNVLHMALSFTAGIVAETILTLSFKFIRKRCLDMSFDMQAIGWLV